MSTSERSRLLVLSRVKSKELSLHEACELIDISYRQVRRLMRRYLSEGDAGLVHGNRGKPSNRQLDATLRSAVLDAYRLHYRGFGATLASEKLEERDHLTVDRGTLRRWLFEEGLLERTRKRSPYRKKRTRRSHFGDLVQLDGSDHNWFGDRAGRSCLMNMVDDATGTTMSFMSDEETTWAAMTVLSQWIAAYGVPRALYVDAKNVYVTQRDQTIEEELNSVDPMTQFGRACNKLGIRIITARSPQAKGRVERNHGVYQDRFVKELLLENVSDVPGANVLLPRYLKSINGKFAIDPQETADYHRPWPEGIKHADVFCLEEKRIIGKDWVVRHHNHYYQILKQQDLPLALSQVIVREAQNKEVRIIHDDRPLQFSQVSKEIINAKKSLAAATTIKEPAKRTVPSVDNPFNRQAQGAKEARERKNQWDAGQEALASLAAANDPRALQARIIA